MKYIIEIYPFAYNKILGGQRKVDLRPYYTRFHNLRVGDVIEYVNAETKHTMLREVKGIALFKDFETLIEMLPPEMIGYNNRDEIRLRVQRMYTPEEEKEYGACAFFIDEPASAKSSKIRYLERSA